MNQTLSMQELADRLVRVESEVSALREELASLRKQTRTSPRTAATRQALAHLCMDKTALRRWINGLFETLSIQGVPIGAEALQAKMAQAGLTPNELSRGIVSAREE
jgi:hypothetical protein